MIDKPQSAYSTVTLDPAPEDAVSRIAFSCDSSSLLVSTWAGTLSVHASQTGALRTEVKRHASALLDAGWHQTESCLIASALDGSVLVARLTESSVNDWNTIGCHQSGARALVPSFGTSASLIASGGWDGKIQLWDLRADEKSSMVAKIEAGGKVFGAACCGSECAVFITSERRVRIIDVRNTGEFLHDREPPTLAHQLRGISTTSNGSQYVVGSTEGRVAVEWLDGSGKDSFSFRCHRNDGLAFPVNCVAHNNRYDSFATGGGDGHVAVWDGEARKRITQFSRYPTSIASIDFDTKSDWMAVAVSYTFEEGEKDHPPDEVLIRKIDDAHIATKRSKFNPKLDEDGNEDGNED